MTQKQITVLVNLAHAVLIVAGIIALIATGHLALAVGLPIILTYASAWGGVGVTLATVGNNAAATAPTPDTVPGGEAPTPPQALAPPEVPHSDGDPRTVP